MFSFVPLGVIAVIVIPMLILIGLMTGLAKISVDLCIKYNVPQWLGFIIYITIILTLIGVAMGFIVHPVIQ